MFMQRACAVDLFHSFICVCNVSGFAVYVFCVHEQITAQQSMRKRSLLAFARVRIGLLLLG